MALEAEDRSGDSRAALVAIVRRKSLITGAPITLVSGRVSRFYFDMKPTLFDPVGANLIAEAVLDAVAGDALDYVGGLEMGAVPIVACVAARSAASRPIPGFFVRKRAKGHGTQRRIEGIERGRTLSGARVAVVEDVTTTAGSALEAVAVAREAGAEVVRVVSVIDRLEGAAERLAAEGLPFSPILTAADFELD